MEFLQVILHLCAQRFDQLLNPLIAVKAAPRPQSAKIDLIDRLSERIIVCNIIQQLHLFDDISDIIQIHIWSARFLTQTARQYQLGALTR